MGFAGREIAGDFLRRERGEVHQSGFHKSLPDRIRKADESNAGDHSVGAAAKPFEHMTGIVRGARLGENVPFQSHDGVGGDDDRRADRPGGDQLGLGSGQALDEVVRVFARVRRFVNGGRELRER